MQVISCIDDLKKLYSLEKYAPLKKHSISARKSFFISLLGIIRFQGNKGFNIQ